MHVCAMKCQGCADNTKVPQLGEGQQRISNARLQGIEKGGSTWFNMATAAVALLQMTISSAGAGYCQLLLNTIHIAMHMSRFNRDAALYHKWISIESAPKAWQKICDGKCDDKRVWICGIRFNLFTVVQYCLTLRNTSFRVCTLSDMISKCRKLY